MLDVKTSAEAEQIIKNRFGTTTVLTQKVCIEGALSRVLSKDITANEFIPDFNRSSVDGYAIAASSSFGCSDSIPAILKLVGEVKMGQTPEIEITADTCCYVPTGGQIPNGADAVVMIEYTEDYDDGTIAILKPCAPAQHIVFKGDDVKPGEVILKKATIITAKDIGALAALGISEIDVFKKPRVAVISTGDELIEIFKKPQGAQIRDINSHTLASCIEACGCEAVTIGIINDDFATLKSAVENALEYCDMLLISGGSSVGIKDHTFKIIDELGEVLLHGIAIKPGKPTIVGDIFKKPVFGLPGHPLAAFFIFNIFVSPLLYSMSGAEPLNKSIAAKITASVPSNHGREECLPVKLSYTGKYAECTPIVSKSGTISVLTNADGYIRILRDCEGVIKGDVVTVFMF